MFDYCIHVVSNKTSLQNFKLTALPSLLGLLPSVDSKLSISLIANY